MAVAIQNASIPKLDDNGLLIHPGQWNEIVALELAYMFDIGEVTNEHWQVIHALRSYYHIYGVAPAMNYICRNLHKDKLWVHNLFGSCLNAWRVAGLPDPGEEAKSYMSDM